MKRTKHIIAYSSKKAKPTDSYNLRNKKKKSFVSHTNVETAHKTKLVMTITYSTILVQNITKLPAL